MQCLRPYRRLHTGPVSLPPSLGTRSLRGFTLIELMVTISVLAVLAAIAVPNFNDLIQRWRVMQAAELFQSTLYLARSEAYKRGGNVVVEKLPCASGGTSEWNCGWQVCHSIAKTCNGGGDTQEIQRQDLSANLDIMPSSSGKNAQSIIFDRFGRLEKLRGFGLSISPKDKGISHPATRGVCLASGGRVRIIPQEEVPCNNP